MRSGIVRRKEARCAVEVVHLANIRGARFDIVVWLEGIASQAITPAQMVTVSGMICISPMAPADETACS